MYELENNSVTWADEETEPVFFKFNIVKANQNPNIETEIGSHVSKNDIFGVEIGSSVTIDLNTYIIENSENYGNYYYGTDSPLVFELVSSIPESEYTTTGEGTLVDGVLTITGNLDGDSYGIFCIKITKAGDNCYNDFEIYIRIQPYTE